MARISIAVKKLDQMFGALHEGIVNFLRHHDGAHWNGGAGQALGKRHNVGRHAEIITAKGRAETPETGDDLVENKQNAVLRAQLAQAFQISHGWHQHAG